MRITWEWATNLSKNFKKKKIFFFSLSSPPPFPPLPGQARPCRRPTKAEPGLIDRLAVDWCQISFVPGQFGADRKMITQCQIGLERRRFGAGLLPEGRSDQAQSSSATKWLWLAPTVVEWRGKGRREEKKII